MKLLEQLTGPPVYPADLLSRCFTGGRVLYGLAWVSYWLTFCKWPDGLMPHLYLNTLPISALLFV